jgi:hypothetical protein
MLRTLAANNPLLYGVLLLFAFALHWPAFHHNYTPTDESLYLICAERIADGGVQYVDAWENKPPLIIWFYTLFFQIFGGQTVVALRLFTVVYLYFSAILFNQLVYNFRVVREFTLMPAILYILTLSVPWYALELNGEMLMALPMLLMLVLLSLFVTDERRSWATLFWVGLMSGLCVCIKYQGIIHVVGMGIAYMMVGKPRLRDMATLLGGLLVPIVLVLLGLHYTRSLSAFWDVGLLYNLDYVRLGYYPGEDPSWLSIFEYLKYWGGFMLLALLGFFSFRVRFYATSIRQRKLETLMAAWLLSGIVSIALGGPRLYLHYAIQILPPILYYALFFLESRLSLAWQNRLLWVACAVPMLSWASYFVLSNPAAINRLKPLIKEDGWTMQQHQQLVGTPQESAIRATLKRYNIRERIWVADYRPELYVRLGYPCATKYTNFSELWNKMNWLPLHSIPNYTLVSKPEELVDLYRTFEREPPACVIDPLGVFGLLQERMPLLLGSYQAEKVGEWQVYFRNPKAKPPPTPTKVDTLPPSTPAHANPGTTDA